MTISICLMTVMYIWYMGFTNLFCDDPHRIPISRTIASAIYVGLLICTVVFGCFQRVQPGEVGVVVNLIGSNRGVEDQELHVGYHLIKPWCKVYRFPIFEQNHQWVDAEGFSFQTSEGLAVQADIGITFNLKPERIRELFAKYHPQQLA